MADKGTWTNPTTVIIICPCRSTEGPRSSKPLIAVRICTGVQISSLKYAILVIEQLFINVIYTDMNTIKLTHNDLQAMINEAVKRTLSAKGVLSEGYRYQGITGRYGRKTPKWSPYKKSPIWGVEEKPNWFDDESEMVQFDNEAVQESIKEDIEDFKYAMEQIAEQAMALVKWAIKKGAKLEFLKKPFDRYMSASAGKAGGKEAKLYLNAKSSDTKEFPWDLAIAFTQMSPEEQEAEIQKYLIPALIDEYQSKYGKYQSEFDAAGQRRSDVMAKVHEILEKYGQTEPSEMSYVDVCEGIKAIKELTDVSYGSGVKEFFEKCGIAELEKKLFAEWKAKVEAAPSYNLGWANGWDEEHKAKYEELRQLMKQGKIYNSRGSGPAESMRGFNHYSGDIVDENGNLIATFSYGVDSSD